MNTVNGSRIPVPAYADVTVERDVECRLPDGVFLQADVYRPAAEISLPVLLIRPSRPLLPVDRSSP
jgi:predicted acyl esterase